MKLGRQVMPLKVISM